MVKPSELQFEDDVVADLLDAGYVAVDPRSFDLELGLDAEALTGFIRTTQPDRWAKYEKRVKKDPAVTLAKKVASDIASRGFISVLRGDVETSGVRFKVGHLPPALNADSDLAKLVDGNVFGVSRQVRFQPGLNDTLDVVLSLNGIPFSTLELKSPLNGQTVKDAVKQYRLDRDYPKNPMLSRAVVHFAVDTGAAKMTTHLAGEDTYFLPFNRGSNPGELSCGAGNPPVALGEDYATSYLWKDVLSPATVLDVFRNYLTVEATEKGGRRIIFPRFHQLDAARRTVEAVLADGVGESYLFQHSAGSGKSKTISWTADRLSRLHDENDVKLFDKVIIITDRRVLDQQLRGDVTMVQGMAGVVATVEEGKGAKSDQLLEALRSSARIVTVTLPSFPYLLQKMDDREFDGQRFAVFADEAHGSQTGDAARALKQALGEGIDVDPEDDEEFDPSSVAAAVLSTRGKQPNLSWFAYTATPKNRTVELFGTNKGSGEKRPFHLYTMRQAIDEGFILDVLKNFTPYPTFFEVGTRDPDFEDEEQEASKVSSAVRKVLTRNPDNIAQKAQIIVEHVRTKTMKQLGGRAQAMVVTDSRQSAMRFKQAIDAYILRSGYEKIKALVAFSGEVTDDDGDSHTETSLNGFPESQTKARFLGEDPHKSGDYQVLVVAEKFQTGFDDPLLTTMFVAKKLSGLHAVQTLSRLNRSYSDGSIEKKDVYVIDFVNQPDAIQEAFQDFYEGRIVNETDPDRLYPIKRDIESTGLLDADEIRTITDAWFSTDTTNPKAMKTIMGTLSALTARFDAADEETQTVFRDRGDEFVRVYGFLSHIMTWVDEELERLYVFMQAALKVTTPASTPGVDLSDELVIKRIAHRAEDPTSIGLEAGAITSGETFGEREDRPSGQGELQLEEVRSIIERINAKHHTEFGEVEVLESGKAVAVLTESEGLQDLVESNDIDEIVGTESKRRLLKALPELEDRSQEFWTAVRQDPEVFTMLAEDLLREACENLKAKRKNRANIRAGGAAPLADNS